MSRRLSTYSVLLGRGPADNRSFSRMFDVTASSPSAVSWTIATLLDSLGCDVAEWSGSAMQRGGTRDVVKFDGVDMAARLASVKAAMDAAK